MRGGPAFNGRAGVAAPRTPSAAFLVVAALAIVAYLPAIRSGYIWDDDLYLTDNPTIVAPDGLRFIWASIKTPQYYPLVFTTFWVEHKLWGLHPAGYHLVNIALHLANALLVGRLLVRLGLPGAWFAAALFALHPVHVESVAWITERKNVLSALFYLLAFYSFLRFEDARHWRWYGAALLCFALALLSKTVTCSLPVALLLAQWARGRSSGLRSVLHVAPFIFIGIVFGMLTIAVERFKVGAVGAEWELSVAERALLAGRALWFYASKLILPQRLIFIYPRWSLDASVVTLWLAPVAAAGLVVAAWWLRSRIGRWPVTALVYFGLTLAPALGFVNVFPMRYSFVADHFQYLASIGILALVAGAAAIGLRRWAQLQADPARARRFGIIATTAVLLALAWLTHLQTYSYFDEETLWRDTLTYNPTAWIAHNNLGAMDQNRGDLEAALRHFEAAARHGPTAWEPWGNLGNAYDVLGRTDEAIAAYQRACRLAPASSKVHTNLAALLRRVSEADRRGIRE